ncbi:DUF308 domain-containing protein [Sphingobacterium daejeonense]|uniref:DUF308 domain-containing protein n=1 Tax=Sphingobacterium daejeonense TaxID=371142 RepID=A0ABW3RND7_9SPHI
MSSKLSFVFSISFLFSGVMEIIFAFNNKNEIDGWGWYLAGGILNTIAIRKGCRY